MYSIGDPENPQPNDKRFETAEAAEVAAVEASVDDHVWAVWHDEDGELLSLVFNQQVFTS